jgi:predicted RNA-binding Zn-ribbon protein involved in translation (DUF1610 family)
MTTELVISTECPTCGAPIDVGEGANALRCRHCGATLLVTGRKQTLSYSIAPRLEAAQAVARVRQAGGGMAGGAAVLWFVPYYRLTGHEFRWQRPPRPRPAPPPRFTALPLVAAGLVTGLSQEEPIDETLRWAGTLVGRLLGDAGGGDTPPADAVPVMDALAARARPARALRPGEAPEFHDRYVDRSFLALDAAELGVPSLGVRAGVLRVRLFHRETLETRGRVAAVTLGEDAAIGYGMEAPDADVLLHRTVIGRVLSVIYFPFWIVPRADAGGALAVVDAIADSVVTLDAPASLAAKLAAGAVPEARTVGFRPLVCPNCGWDLPVVPEDVIFFCGQCERAWQIHGRDLHPVPFEVAEVSGPSGRGDLVHLPFWVLDTGAAPPRFFAPAFRFRRLKYLSDLSRNLVRKPPTYGTRLGPRPPLGGCHYDVEDAMLLARFTQAGLDPAAPPLPVRAATLTWFPFRREQRALRDPFTGLTLPEHLLSPAAAAAGATGATSR